MEGNEKEKKHNQDAQTGDQEMAGTEVGETPSSDTMKSKTASARK